MKIGELLAELESLREQVCPYTGDRCDCKYVTAADTSEATGCCELRDLIEHLQNPGPQQEQYTMFVEGDVEKVVEKVMERLQSERLLRLLS